MNRTFFQSNIDFTAGGKGLKPTPPLGPHDPHHMPIFGVISSYTRAREKTTKTVHMVPKVRRRFQTFFINFHSIKNNSNKTPPPPA